MEEPIENIFISHSSQDKLYVQKIVSLLSAMDISNIVCSSIQEYSIPLDEDIYDYLKRKLEENTKVIFVLSDNYYKSIPCLNEMGACWVLNKSYTSVLTPNFQFNQIEGAINPNRISFKLDDGERLTEFITQFRDNTSTNRLSYKSIQEICEATTKEVEELAELEKKTTIGVRGTIEGIRFSPIKQEEFEIRFRLRNTENQDQIIYNLKFSFVDSEGNKYEYEYIPDELIEIYSLENRVFKLCIPNGSSLYSPYIRNKEYENVIVDFDIDVWK